MALGAESVFVCISQYSVSLEELKTHLDDHIVWLTSLDKTGRVVATGRREPWVGGIMVLAGNSVEDVREVLSTDPFQIRGCAIYHVHEFVLNPDPVKGRLMEYFTGEEFNAENSTT